MPICKHCGAKLSKDKGSWIDMTGGDVCPVNETPIYDDEDTLELVQMVDGPHEPEIKQTK